MVRIFLKSTYACIVLAAFCVSCPAQESWLLQRDNGHWERFSSESAWRKAATAIQPLETAVVNQTASETSVVYDVQGESGDWRNIDHYLFRPTGTLIKLQRSFASVSQDIRLNQVFELTASGMLRKTKEAEVSLKTGKAKKKVSEEEPKIPIASNMEQLNFMKILK